MRDPSCETSSAAREINTSCKHTNSWEGSSGPRPRMIGNPAKIWLSNQPRGKTHLLRFPLSALTDGSLLPCSPLPTDRNLPALEAKLFFERSSWIHQPSSEMRQKLAQSSLSPSLLWSTKEHAKKTGLVPLTLVLIGDRSPSILAESSCQFLSSASYSVCVRSLSIPHEKSHARSRQRLPSPRCRCCTPSSLTWIPGAREALRAEKSAPLLALFPLSFFFLVLSPPSLSSLSLSIISLQLSVYHAHLTNDLCLRYRIWAKKSGLNKLQGSSPKSEEANAT